MTRLALEEFSATELADEFAIASGDLAAHGDHAWSAFDFPAFEGTVVHVHVLGLHGNFAAIIWVEHHKVGVGAGLDSAFAGKKVKGLRDLRAGDVYKGVQVDFSRFHAIGIKQVDALFE